MNANTRTARQQRGFTITQMIITLAIIAIVSTFGVLGINTARAQFHLQSAARLFASYIEKARADSVRRHAGPGQEASVETFESGTNTYTITMDFGSGAVETRTFTLESGLSFDTIPQKVTFDWRGRIPKAWVFQIHSDYLNQNYPVDVSGSGDITVGSQHFLDEDIPGVEISEVTDDENTGSDPIPTPTPSPSASPTASPSPSESATPTPTPNGNGNGNGGSGNGNGNGNTPTPTPTPNPTPNPSATPTPTPTPMPQCVATLSPSTLSLSQSDETNQTGSATFTLINATGTRIISASQAGNGNSMVIGISLQRIDGSGSTIISVTTKHGAGNRGVFLVNVTTDPACGASSQQLTVSVSN